MRSTSPIAIERRTRQARRRASRRTAFAAAGVAVAMLGTVSIAAVAPLSAATASDRFGTISLASYSTRIAPPVTGAPSAEAAIDAAHTSIAAAAQITADIQQAGLDVGTPDVVVDTSKLGRAVETLSDAYALLPDLTPDLVKKVTRLTAPVDARVAELRAALDAAKQRKAAEEAAAAEAARVAAEQAAAAAAAEAAAAEAAAEAEAEEESSDSYAWSPNYASAGTSAGEAQAIARGMLAGYGWGDDQFGCLVALWDRESGWNVHAHNSSSGAHGIPQALPGSKMGSAGPDWENNATTQISWGLGYIAGRYGSPCGAWGHSESNGWY
ncbi:lytic transglycosylase domain-containing protein [Microbacterium sp. BWT-B31]|uniref:aggregation-promoting factor C-terminal-like domain-containing protein n=1 Tax=Microbacterium sp. BWT-B31 TaxID=3232072 RepID=UPI0035294103